MRRFFLSLSLLATLSGVIQAQEGKVPVTLFCFRYAPDLQNLFVKIGTISYRGVTLSTANMIGPVNAALFEGKITIHQEVTDGAGRKSWPLVARSPVGAIVDPLIVLLPRSDEKGPIYRSFVIDRAKSKFPDGSYQLINFSPHPVRARVGGRSVLSASGTIQKLRPVSIGGRMMRVEIDYHDGNRWRPMTKTRWAYRSDRRSLLLLYLDPVDKRMNLRSIPDRVISPAAVSC